jgi:anti-sigma B factor antagonist
MENRRPVIVLQLPEKLVFGTAQIFFREIEPLLKSRRPRVVFDFSTVGHVDSAGIEMLLNSTEEVMKRNGDLKLAGIRPGPAALLELTKVDRLFEIYDQTADAVESFHGVPAYAFQAEQPWSREPAVESGSAA